MTIAHASRRRLLALAAAALLPMPALALARRIAIIDWAALETALMLGIVPVAVAELRQFRAIAVEPVVPHTVADLGLRGAPNMERLLAVRPDLIVISNFYEGQRAAFARIAPVLSLPVYLPGRPPYAEAVKAARALGAATGYAVPAQTAIAATDSRLAELAVGLAPVVRSRPWCLISIGDARHVRAFGRDSLFGDVLERLGGRNAWSGGTRYAATAPVGIEALARFPDAAIVAVGPTPPDALRVLADSALWRALPAVAQGRVYVLPPINHYGGLPAARRFAESLSAATRGEGMDHA